MTTTGSLRTFITHTHPSVFNFLWFPLNGVRFEWAAAEASGLGSEGEGWGQMKGQEGFRVGVKGRRYQIGKVSSSATRRWNCGEKVERRLHVVNKLGWSICRVLPRPSCPWLTRHRFTENRKWLIDLIKKTNSPSRKCNCPFGSRF